LTVGLFLPVSGAEKSTFPEPSLEGLHSLVQASHLHPRKQMFGLGRIGSVTFPGLFALLYLPFVVRCRKKDGRLALRLREGYGRLTEVLVLTALATIVLAAYDAFFVVPWHIGEWYAPVSILFVTLVTVQAASAVPAHWQRWRSSLGWAAGSAAFALALCYAQVVYFFEFHRLLPWGKSYASFCIDQARRAVNHYAGAPPRLLSRDDGVVAFGTGFPTTSGTRLALDAEAAEAAADENFEQLLARRGVDHLTAFHYGAATGFRLRERSERVQAFAESVLIAPPQRQYEVVYVDGTFGIVRAVH
jgi:hypothetical protein